LNIRTGEETNLTNGNKPYEKTCTFCKETIRMALDKEGKWKPFNLNNGPHMCKKKQEELKEIYHNQTKEEFSLEQVLKKLECIGITLDLKKLLKESDYIK
jgi:hypothetical protein